MTTRCRSCGNLTVNNTGRCARCGEPSHLPEPVPHKPNHLDRFVPTVALLVVLAGLIIWYLVR